MRRAAYAACFTAVCAAAQELPPAPSQGAPAPTEPSGVSEEATRVPRPAPPGTPVPAAERLSGWRSLPRVLLSETYTDNIARAPRGPDKEKGWITRLSPGIRLEGGGARTQGFVDYQRNQFWHSPRSDLDTGENLLNSWGNVELVQQHLFVDARARVLQADTSPFGSSTFEAPGANPNRTETSVLQLSPYLRGGLGDRARYLLRFNAAASHASGEPVPDTTIRESLGRIQNTPGAGSFGWQADASRLNVQNHLIGTLEDSRVRAGLLYAPAADLRLGVYHGVERSDFTGERQRRTTPGAGMEWTPNSRTQLAAVAERRFFGTGHSLLATHRTPFMALRYADQKDVSTLPGRLAVGQSSIQGMMSDLLAASIRDPAARADAVRSRLERTGAVEYAPVSLGFLTSAATVASDRELTAAFLGRANTVTLIGSRIEHRALGESLGLVGLPSSQGLRVQGYSASWAHQLSPVTSLTLSDSRRQTRDLTSDLGSRQHGTGLTLLRQIGPRTLFSIGGRHTTFRTNIATPYVENAVAGSLLVHF